jgi:long-subunit fatty acid transport protein
MHEPAALAGVRVPTLTLVLSTFAASLESNPGRADQNLSTGTSITPVPMLAAAMPVTRRVVLGLAAYPSGAAGGEFHYTSDAGVPSVDRLSALLVELTPGAAVQVTPSLRVGLGWRLTFLRFEREAGAEEDPTAVSMHLSGAHVTGFRVGLEWRPIPFVRVAAAYRHRVDVPASAASGMLLGAPAEDIDASLVVPAKLSLGWRLDLGKLGLVTNLDLVWNSQQQAMVIDARIPSQDAELSLPIQFRWDDSFVLKTGAEVRVRPDLRVRLGWAYDARTTNRRYPSAFTSPPTSSQYVTAGVGWELGRFQLDLALVHRFSTSTYIAGEDIAPPSECPFCGKQGRYAASASAVMVGFTARFAP